MYITKESCRTSSRSSYNQANLRVWCTNVFLKVFRRCHGVSLQHAVTHNSSKRQQHDSSAPTKVKPCWHHTEQHETMFCVVETAKQRCSHCRLQICDHSLIPDPSRSKNPSGLARDSSPVLHNTAVTGPPARKSFLFSAWW